MAQPPGSETLRPAAARQQGRQHPEARPHARHHLVRRGGVDDLRRGEPEGLAVARALARPLAGDGHVDAVIAQNAGKEVDVGKTRNVVKRQRLAGEKAGNHQGQRSVLGATDRYGAVQALAADNADAVHGCYSLAPLSPSRSLKTPVFIGPAPVRLGPTVQSTPAGLALSPLIAIPCGTRLGLGLRLAFQQVGCEAPAPAEHGA